MDSASQPAFRIGIGHDLHRLEPGGPLRLGGVDVPSDLRAVGHSDADVLLHAVTDALLGGTAMGDIGEWFSDGPQAPRGRDSAEFVAFALQAAARAGYQPANLDCTVFLQDPRLTAHKTAIRESLAALLGLPVERVSVKAKSGEGIGPIGQRQAVSAQAAVLLSAGAAREGRHPTDRR